MWKDRQCGEANLIEHFDAGSTKKRKKQPATVPNIAMSCSESGSDGAVDSDAAFDILSLLSVLHEPGNTQQRREEQEVPTMSLDRGIAHSAEWLLLDVIDSLEQSAKPAPISTSTASAGSMEANHPLTRINGMTALLQTDHECPQAELQTPGGHAEQLCESQQANERHAIPVEACTGAACGEGLKNRSTEQESIATRLAGSTEASCGASEHSGAGVAPPTPLGTCMLTLTKAFERLEGIIRLHKRIGTITKRTRTCTCV